MTEREIAQLKHVVETLPPALLRKWLVNFIDEAEDNELKLLAAHLGTGED